MAKKKYLPDADDKKVIWLLEFENKLALYAAKYSVTPAEVAAVTADKDYFNFWWQYHLQVQVHAQNVTAFKNSLRDGIPGGATAPTEPVPPAMGVVPAAVLPDVFGRSTSIANRIKKHSAYTIADGEAMGIEGAELTLPDLVNIKPEISVVLIGGVPRLKWSKNGMDGIEIMVNRNPAGSWSFLALDTIPDYDDTYALPATEETWQYKAIYHYHDSRVGQWSEAVSVRVKA